MAKDDEVLEEMDSEEVLLDFDLEDLSPEELDGGENEGEVIDLVDLVEEGKEDLGVEDDAIANLLEEDRSGGAQQDISISTDEISAIPDLLEDEGAVEIEQSASAADISLSDLEVEETIDESAQETEAVGASEVTEADVEELDLGFDDEAVPVEDRPEADIPEIDLSGVFDEGEEETGPVLGGAGAKDDNIEEMLGATIEATVAEVVIEEEEISDAVVAEVERRSPEASDEVASPDSQADPQAGAPAVSPEKIEAIVRDVVQEVVERVVREAVAEVAERVITEAIEALKQKIESSA